MDLKEFENILIKGLKDNKIEEVLNNNKIELLFKYMKYIIEKNKSINLTAITDEVEFIYKHFIDSLYLAKYIKKGSLLDIGTGAGFPGIPLLIFVDDLNVSFLDSRNKKLLVIEEFIINNNLKHADFLHERAEMLHKDNKFNKKYDYVTTRAVSNIENVINYSIPYLKRDGISIAMRGQIEDQDELTIKNNKYIKEVDIYLLKDDKNNPHKRSILLLKK